MEPQALFKIMGAKRRGYPMRACDSLTIQGKRNLYEYPLPYCNSGNHYCFMLCSIVLLALSSHSHLPLQYEKRAIRHLKVPDSPDWLLQDADSPCQGIHFSFHLNYLWSPIPVPFQLYAIAVIKKVCN